MSDRRSPRRGTAGARRAQRSGPYTALGTALVVVSALAAAPAASADEQITAVPPNQFLPSSVTIDQGERLTFLNADLSGHDVKAKGLDPRGMPLFETPLTGFGQEEFVRGSQYLTTGSYPFYCSVHPFMEGTLAVTGAGRPVPRPPDRTPPRLGPRILSSSTSEVRRSGKLKVSIRSDEAASISLRASTRRSDGRRIGIASARVRMSRPAERTVAMKLTAAGKRALEGARRAKVSLSASGKDTAGNKARRSTSRTLGR